MAAPARPSRPVTRRRRRSQPARARCRSAGVIDHSAGRRAGGQRALQRGHEQGQASFEVGRHRPGHPALRGHRHRPEAHAPDGHQRDGQRARDRNAASSSALHAISRPAPISVARRCPRTVTPALKLPAPPGAARCRCARGSPGPPSWWPGRPGGDGAGPPLRQIAVALVMSRFPVAGGHVSRLRRAGHPLLGNIRDMSHKCQHDMSRNYRPERLPAGQVA